MNLRNFFRLLAAAFMLGSAAVAQIKPDTAVQISITGVPQEEQGQINGVYPVAASGTISMPHIGQIRAVGLTPASLARSIEAAYRAAEIYTTPTIQVLADDRGKLNARRVVVGGYVRRPGPVELVNDMNIWQAIQAAGGENEFGSIRRVILRRAGKSRTLDLRQSQFKEIQLEENDSIEIPQKTPFGN
jgi:polysaccharide biosynthesis/export protein VpsN